jgi:hypothetical protein
MIKVLLHPHTCEKHENYLISCEFSCHWVLSYLHKVYNVRIQVSSIAKQRMLKSLCNAYFIKC